MPNQDVELRSEDVQEILHRMPHWMIRWGNVIILTILLLILLMAWIIKYPEIVEASVTITTRNPPEKLVARTSGKITSIMVANGQTVNKGQALAVIDNTANYADVARLREIIDQRKITPDFNFPIEQLANMQLGTIEPAIALFEKDYVAYRLNYDLNPYVVDGSAHNFELGELRQRLALLNDQRELAEQELKIKTAEIERYKKLYEKGVIAAQEWDVKNMEYLQFQKGLKTLTSSISQMRSSLNDIDKSSKKTKISETKDDVSLYRNIVQSYNQLKEAINQWELQYVLRAGIAGKVSFLQIWKENQTVTSGENIFTVIPTDGNNYIGKLKAAALNSGKIQVGQDVNIHLANYPDREFGVLRGKIEYIAMTPDKDGNLLIDVSLPKKLETSYHKIITFQQEMIGSVDIITQDLRLIERIFYQFRDIFSRKNTDQKKGDTQ